MSHPDNRIPPFSAHGHNCIKTPTGNHYSKHVQPGNDFEQSDRVTLRNNGSEDTRPAVYQPLRDPSLEGISTEVYECSNTATLAAQPGGFLDLSSDRNACSSPVQSPVTSTSVPNENMAFPLGTCNGSKVVNKKVVPVSQRSDRSGYINPVQLTFKSNGAPCENMVNYAQASEPQRPVHLPCDKNDYSNTVQSTVESNSVPSENMVLPQETCKGSKVVNYAVAHASQQGRPVDLSCGTSGCNTPLQSTVESSSAPSQNMVFAQETCNGSKVVNYPVAQALQPGRPVDLPCGTSGRNTPLQSTVESNSAPSQKMIFTQETSIASKVVNYAVAQASQCKRPVDLSFDKSGYTKRVQSTVQSNSALSQNMVFSHETCNENKVVNHTVAPVSWPSDRTGHNKPVQSTVTSNVSSSQSMVFPQETFNRNKVVNYTVAPVSQPPDRRGPNKSVQSTVTSNTASSQNMVVPQETFNRNKVVYCTVAPVSQPQRPVDLPLDRSGFNKPVQATVTSTIAPSQNMVSPRETFSKNKVVSNTGAQLSKPLRPVDLPSVRSGFNTVQSIVARPSAPSKIMVFPQGTFHSGKVESDTVAQPLKPVRPVNLPSGGSGYNNPVQSTVKVEGVILSSAGILINSNLQGDKHGNQQLLNVNKVHPEAYVMFVNKPLPTTTISCSPLVSEIRNFTANQPSTVAVKQNYVQPGTHRISSATRLSAGSLVSGIHSTTSESRVSSDSNPYFQQPSANDYTNRRPTDSLPSGTQIPLNSGCFQAADKPYKCPKCSLSFSTEELYNRHIPVHYKKCPHCSEEFRSLKAPYRDLLQHVVLFHKDKDPCNLAHKSTVFSALRGASPGHFRCCHCTDEFDSLRACLEHRVHSHMVKECWVCQKTFKTADRLRNHVKTHTGEKTYTCPHCFKSFRTSSTLGSHVKRHTGQVFRCEQCPFVCVAKSNLEIHMNTHTGAKPYKCQYCPMAFGAPGRLTIHERSHIGEKPFACDHCDKAFVDKYSLVRHVRTHTGEKPYKCSYCNKAFAQGCQLQFHERTHTGEKPYQCLHCQKKFTRRQELNKHLVTHEKINQETKSKSKRKRVESDSESEFSSDGHEDVEQDREERLSSLRSTKQRTKKRR